jgi:hypothetical protein
VSQWLPVHSVVADNPYDPVLGPLKVLSHSAGVVLSFIDTQISMNTNVTIVLALDASADSC